MVFYYVSLNFCGQGGVPSGAVSLLILFFFFTLFCTFYYFVIIF